MMLKCFMMVCSHIAEHLDGVVDQQDQYSEEEMQFHYFKAHDYDNNNKLDGLELISALTHYHKGQLGVMTQSTLSH